MKKIFIDGMMCQHCANAVKNVLEELGGKNVSVNLDEGYAEVDIDVTNEVIIEKISEEDFEVTEIQ